MKDSNFIDEDNKIYVAGDKAVGKTTLVSRLCGEKFKQIKENTIPGITSRSDDRHEDYKITYLDISDLDNNYKYIKVIGSEMDEVKAVFIIFSYDNFQSYEKAKVIYDYILDNTGNCSFPIIIVGNKTDLLEESKEEEKSIESISSKDKNKFDMSYFTNSKQNNYINFKVSMKNDDDVTEIEKFIKFNVEFDKQKKRKRELSIKKAKEERSCMIL